tara:strand:+ start:2914 stop:3819 length:906 start_codon:yes stop_codon:yes gene_type:complete
MVAIPPASQAATARVSPRKNIREQKGLYFMPSKPKEESANIKQATNRDPIQAGAMYTRDNSSTESNVEDDLLQLLKDRLYGEYMTTSKFEKTPREFLPRDQFKRILSDLSTNRTDGNDEAHTVLQLMHIEPEKASKDDRALADYVLKGAMKVFLILICIKFDHLHAAMTLFKNKNKGDSDLPFDVWDRKKMRSNIRNHPFVLMETGDESEGERTRTRTIWKLDSIHDFHNAQWDFLAPVISTATWNCNFGLRTMPFIAKGATPSSGAHGIVRSYTVHSAHFEDLSRPVSVQHPQRCSLHVN